MENIKCRIRDFNELKDNNDGTKTLYDDKTNLEIRYDPSKSHLIGKGIKTGLRVGAKTGAVAGAVLGGGIAVDQMNMNPKPSYSPELRVLGGSIGGSIGGAMDGVIYGSAIGAGNGLVTQYKNNKVKRSISENPENYRVISRSGKNYIMDNNTRKIYDPSSEYGWKVRKIK